MEGYLLALWSAIWLGILTSISPCPLATNITAISYISKRLDRPFYIVMAGLLYTLGRTLAYVIIGMLIVASVLAIPDLSFFLQRTMNKFIGPLLVVVGLFLVGAFRFRLSGPTLSDRLQKRIEKLGLLGALAMGMLFALSFCPVSAALFFGSLIPIAVQQQSSIMMPTAYGIGTALPVVLFAILIATGARFVGTAFNKLAVFEKWARRATGVIFIGAGIYYILVYLFGIQF